MHRLIVNSIKPFRLKRGVTFQAGDDLIPLLLASFAPAVQNHYLEVLMLACASWRL